jgi:serine phosphatase RsbU (regulator of sigma subunit)
LRYLALLLGYDFIQAGLLPPIGLPPFLTVGPLAMHIVPGYRIAIGLLFILLMARQAAQDRSERERLASELEAARAMQQLLLPKAEAAGVEAVYQPAAEVGGDFYYVEPLDDGGLLVVVGDVSGKGLKAAMLVSMVVGALRRDRPASPGEVLAGLNEALVGYAGGGFVTCCCARFAADGKSAAIANAGHPAPYVDGGEIEVEGGLPLGVVSGAVYGEARVEGRAFTFVSDGVVEAANAQGELFGFERTRAISMKSAQEIAEAARAWGQNDDITVVTVRRRQG